MLIQAVLGDLPIAVGHSAGTELKIAVMIRRQLHANWYNGSSPITANDYAVPIFATRLVNTWLKNTII